MSTTTQRVYKPIVDHGELHRLAIENMTRAVIDGDAEATKKHFDEAQYHAQMQHEAGIEARRYFLGKVKHA